MLWTASEGVSKIRLKRYERLIKAKSTVLTLFKTEKIGLTAFLKTQRILKFESAKYEYE